MFNCSNHYKILKPKNISIKKNNILRIVNIGSKTSKTTANFCNSIINCNIGTSGSTYNKREGDKKTPKGIFYCDTLYCRPDKIKFIKSHLKKEIIKKNYKWCDNVSSYSYNKLIKNSNNYGSEILWRNDNLYDLIITTTHNQSPVLKHRGSAIFLHIHNDENMGSLGCITFKVNHLRRIIANLNNKTVIFIN
jgi:L,D-peptidoglycan transpeptidase YkuD (ErfK/YbiS/YcfS/YnhG family)